ncbi:polyprenyl synthetase family protein [Psychrobacter sp. AOP22-C1-22]|uniref:polyprenyl synthetase family protein n=1 Tax=unclassified Psychrobacter TaxID=196806 RepID=UPI001787BCB4|nr:MULTISPECIES: polyprenyl synthetase family protein [unclassified Psychrobacter]MBE0407818.1 polyprenyl synthetase family protein [Psychrobacter sp. FME6]MBE0445755.1 polyprenyl synthetase family protein [Psychrobacter sp. FME5]MDN5802106.1 polyprenyl synthetase family protein [Psychrobacter sp.]MDN5892003.1 polyprenyl synthetase family protein [Psychrobacter sp.]
MTVSSTPSVMPLSFMSFDSTEQFHHAVRTQLAQDIDVLFAYAELPSPLIDACRYVMTGQGKLVRPLLVASAFASVNDYRGVKDNDKGSNKETDINDNLASLLENDSDFDMYRRAALAVELLHTYSLVHDDLPCMDDDELRRGQPTAHIVFDESTALLAGDVLQTLAFEVLTAEMPTFAPFDSAIASQLFAIFAPRARRMVSGQMLDLNAEASNSITQANLEAIHRDKTGALIEAAMLMGGICAGATAPQRMALQDCAQNIGLAFQVQDDILDVTTSTDALGKPAGSDEKLDKSTYVKLMGVNEATNYAQSLFNDGRAAISRELGDNPDSDALLALIEWLWSRKK